MDGCTQSDLGLLFESASATHNHIHITKK